MKISVRRIGRITVDHQAPAQRMADAILKHQRERLAARIDAADRAFPAYSPLYRAQLQALGEDTSVDLKESGELGRSIRVLRTESRGGRVVITFGVGSGTSPRRPRPPPWVFAGTPDENARSLERWRRSPKRATRSLPHSQLLGLLVGGNRESPPRQVLGVSPRGRGPVVRAIEKAPVFRS